MKSCLLSRALLLIVASLLLVQAGNNSIEHRFVGKLTRPCSKENWTYDKPIMENRALWTELGAAAASPCQSLGLGSSSSGQGDEQHAPSDDSASNETTTRQSSSTVESTLSNNSTAEKSCESHSQGEAIEDATSGSNESMQPLCACPVSNEASNAAVGAILPEEVTTTAKNISSTASAPMSPLSSPDTFRLSSGDGDAIESAADASYAGFLAIEDIAGLSPIMPSRESGHVARIQSSPRHDLEDVSRHAEPMLASAEEPVNTSTSFHRSQDNTPTKNVNRSLAHNSINEESEEPSKQELDCGDHEVSNQPKVVPAHSDDEASRQSSTTSTRSDTPQVLHQVSIHDESKQDSCFSDAKKGLLEVAVPDTSTIDDEAAAMGTHSKELDNSQHSRREIALLEQDESAVQDVNNGDAAEAQRSPSDESTGLAATTQEDVSPPSLVAEPTEGLKDSEEREYESNRDADTRMSPGGDQIGEQQEEAKGDFDHEHSLESVSSEEQHKKGGNHLDDTSSEEYSVHNDGTDATTQQERALTYRDLTSAKKNLDASSTAFIERLRGAAHRRKLRVARSRDSLAAKEREHLLSIASANERRLEIAPKKQTAALRPASTTSIPTKAEPYKPFKARRAPSTTGRFGSGGQVGIPKVVKKPTTTPFSPLLGSRRPKKEHLAAPDHSPPRKMSHSGGSRLVTMVANSLTPKKTRGHSLSFKARPAPATTGMQGHGGQVGVPKVAKRPATVPVSPRLGSKRGSFLTVSTRKEVESKQWSSSKTAKRPPQTAAGVGKRRISSSPKPFGRILSGSEASRAKDAVRLERIQQEADEARKQRVFRARPLPENVFKSGTSLVSNSPVLLGLEILNHQAPSTNGERTSNNSATGSENINPQPEVAGTPQQQIMKPKDSATAYEPHSTVRAKKRASFDQLRSLHEVERQETEDELRRATIQQKRAELARLGKSLSR